MKFVWVSIIMIICLSLFLGSSLYEADIERNITTDVYNFTQSNFYINETAFPLYEFDSSKDYNQTNNDIISLRITNIINKNFETITYSFFELTRMGVEVGYNSQDRYKLSGMITFMKTILILVMIGLCFYPALVVGTLIYELYKMIRRKIKQHKIEQSELTK